MFVASSLAAFDGDGRLLMIRRADVGVWGLPRGKVETNETVVEAAERELLEETGFRANVTRLVGLYSEPMWHGQLDLFVLFCGTIVGGKPNPAVAEVTEMGFFSPADLPRPMLAQQRHRIADVVAGARGIVKRELRPWPLPHVTTESDLRAAIADSGKSAGEFYVSHFPELRPDEIRIEVDG